jgi:hypothetical protein
MAIEEHEARVNITWAQQNGDLPDPVAFDATDANILTWATEAVRGGDVPGIEADQNADFDGYVVERFASKEEVPYNRLVVRPKAEFG